MSPPTNPDRDPAAFAATRLGPHSARYVERADVRARIDEDIGHGRMPSDAVLVAIKQQAGEDRAIEDELAGYILPLAMAKARARLAPEPWLHGFLETSDLAASVVGRLWPHLSELSFETEAQFSALLGHRMAHRITDHARALRSAKRGEDRREGCTPEELSDPPVSSRPGPPQDAMNSERSHSFRRALEELTPRERRVLELFVYEHKDRSEIAEELGIRYEAARAALRRAGAHIKRLLGDD